MMTEGSYRKMGREKDVFRRYKNDIAGSRMKAERLKSTLQRLKDGEQRSKLRNQSLLQDFDKVNSMVDNLETKARKLKKVKQQYEAYINSMYPRWKENIDDINTTNESRCPEDEARSSQTRSSRKRSPLHSTMNGGQDFERNPQTDFYTRKEPVGFQQKSFSNDINDYETGHRRKHRSPHRDRINSRRPEHMSLDLFEQRQMHLDPMLGENYLAQNSRLRSNEMQHGSPLSVSFDSAEKSLEYEDFLRQSRSQRPNFLNVPMVNHNEDISNFTVLPQALALSPDGQLVLLPMAISPRMQAFDGKRQQEATSASQPQVNKKESLKERPLQDSSFSKARKEDIVLNFENEREAVLADNRVYEEFARRESDYCDLNQNNSRVHLNSTIPQRMTVENVQSRESLEVGFPWSETIIDYKESNLDGIGQSSLSVAGSHDIEDMKEATVDIDTESRKLMHKNGTTKETLFDSQACEGKKEEKDGVLKISKINSFDGQNDNTLDTMVDVRIADINGDMKKENNRSFEEKRGDDQQDRYSFHEEMIRNESDVTLSEGGFNDLIDDKKDVPQNNEEENSIISNVKKNPKVAEDVYVIEPKVENVVCESPRLASAPENELFSRETIENEKIPDLFIASNALDKTCVVEENNTALDRPDDQEIISERSLSNPSELQSNLKDLNTSDGKNIAEKLIDMPEISFLYEEIENRMEVVDKKEFYRVAVHEASQDVIDKLKRTLRAEGDLSLFETSDLCIVSRMVTADYVKRNSSNGCIIKEGADLSTIYTLDGFREIVIPEFEELWEYIFNHMELLYGNMIFESNTVCEIFSQLLCIGNSDTAFEVSKTIQRIMDGGDEDFENELTQSDNNSYEDVESTKDDVVIETKDLKEDNAIESLSSISDDEKATGNQEDQEVEIVNSPVIRNANTSSDKVEDDANQRHEKTSPEPGGTKESAEPKDFADLPLDLGNVSEDDDNSDDDDSSTFDSAKLTPRKIPMSPIKDNGNIEGSVEISSIDNESESEESLHDLPNDVEAKDKEDIKTSSILEEINEDSESSEDLDDILNASLGRNKVDNKKTSEDSEKSIERSSEGAKTRSLLRTKQDSFEVDDVMPKPKISENPSRKELLSPDHSKSISTKFRKPGFWENSDSDSEAGDFNISGGNNLSQKNDDEDEFDFGFFT